MPKHMKESIVADTSGYENAHEVQAEAARNDNLAEVIDLRVQVYGDQTITFPQIALVWSGILGIDVKPTDVPLMLIGMKLVRAAQAPDYSDNSDDVEGYLDIFRKVVDNETGMVHARSVNEYIEKKLAQRS